MKKAIALILTTSILLGACTASYVRKGDKHFEALSYAKAINFYEKALKKKENMDTRIKLANAYRLSNNYVKASQNYTQVVNSRSGNYAPIVMFYHAKMQMSMGRSKEAAKWFSSYLKVFPNDMVARLLLASCNSMDDFKVDTTLYTLKQIEFSETKTQFSPIPFKDGIVFAADKDPGMFDKKSAWTGSTYLDLYFSQKDEKGQWISPQILKGDINGQYHEGPATFNEKGDLVYFTRSNYFKRKMQKNDDNVNNLKIFSAELKGDKWTNLVEFPYNSDDYSCGHPTLSADGKTLYFVSDMPGGFGGTDLYKSVWDGSKWGKPINLGKEVNTSGNEMFPYIHSDNTLYFSSDAHNSMGGLDVFMTYNNGTKYLQVENLNYPLNSNRDDFGYVVNKDNKTGFVSSNRTGDDRIYEFTKNDPTFTIKYTAIYKNTKKPAEGINVQFWNKDANTKIDLVTGKDGKLTQKMVINSDYTVRSSKEGYFTLGSDLSNKGKKISEVFEIVHEMDEIIIEKPIVLENIYYDLDKWFIREDAAKELDKMVRLLNDNPNIHVEMSSHTDSRAGDQYNLVLSDKRAKAAVEYLVANGIDKNRLKWKGYGESKLVNQCKNDVPCTEEEHQQNRRTEFKVIKINK